MEENKVEHILLRVRIRSGLYKKFKILCIQKDISLPKQVEKLVSDFLKEDRIEIPFEMIDKKEK